MKKGLRRGGLYCVLFSHHSPLFLLSRPHDSLHQIFQSYFDIKEFFFSVFLFLIVSQQWLTLLTSLFLKFFLLWHQTPLIFSEPSWLHPLSLSLGSYSLGFFSLSVASTCLPLKIFFPISFPNISGSEVFLMVWNKSIPVASWKPVSQSMGLKPNSTAFIIEAQFS